MLETTLFDRTGHPVAYLTNDASRAVYLWSGVLVAWVDHETLYGWNGRHLGFYVRGVVYDVHGKRVGSIQAECAFVTQEEPAKADKYSKRLKHPPQKASARPKFSMSSAATPLEAFLERGAVTAH